MPTTYHRVLGGGVVSHIRGEQQQTRPNIVGALQMNAFEFGQYSFNLDGENRNLVFNQLVVHYCHVSEVKGVWLLDSYDEVRV